MKKLALTTCALLLFCQSLAASNSVFAKAKSKTAVKEESKSKALEVKISNIANSPVEIVSAKAKMDLDEFGSPLIARMYIKYKNTGKAPIAAVRFRLGYLDEQGKDIGFFHALHAAILSPSCVAEGKWTGKVSANLKSIKVSPLAVRFPEGKDWKSKKMLEIEEEKKEISPEQFQKMNKDK